MIDLFQFVDKNVTVKFRNGDIHEGRITLYYVVNGFPFRFNYKGGRGSSLYKQNGYWAASGTHSQDIVAIREIEEVEPAIGLSQFVDKNVTVTFRDGTTTEGIIGFNNDHVFCYKFEIVNGVSFSYTDAGLYCVTHQDGRDIVAIEEIKPVVAENEVPTLSWIEVRKTQLEAEWKELEVRKTQLEAELEEVERQIRVASGPVSFSASEVFNFLQTGGQESISLMFNWNSTPQGYEHWHAIRTGDKKLSREDVEYLLNCLSKHFLRKFE